MFAVSAVKQPYKSYSETLQNDDVMNFAIQIAATKNVRLDFSSRALHYYLLVGEIGLTIFLTQG